MPPSARRPAGGAPVMLMGMFLLIPVMQLGFSYYASFSMVMLVLVIAHWSGPLLQGARTANLLLAMGLLLLIPLFTVPTLSFSQDLLRIGREAVMFGILASALVAFRNTPPRDAPIPLWFLALLLSFLLAMCIVQQFYFARSVYVGFPEEWFLQETGTIASELSLRYTGALLRPHATFAEPSYLAFILLSFSIMLVPRTDHEPAAWWLMLIIILTGLLSRSLAFLFVMAGVILFPLMLERRRNNALLIGGTIVIVVLMLSLTEGGNRIAIRLLEVGTGAQNDTSTLARIILPMQVLPSYFEAYPFGAPFSVIERAMAPFMPDAFFTPSDILQNAVFNLVFLYGIGGVVVLTTLVLLGRDLRARLYIVACAMFNGAFLAIDKVAIITLTLAIYEGGKAIAADRARRAAAARVPARPPSRALQA